MLHKACYKGNLEADKQVLNYSTLDQRAALPTTQALMKWPTKVVGAAPPRLCHMYLNISVMAVRPLPLDGSLVLTL
eukprot:m.37566 g.37566  ORF g.37566 m.37566 type:complete len:76 (-) comp12518_c0_seq1:687-914(-)